MAAARANWRPFLALQAAALAMVVAYYQADGVRTALDAVGRLRDGAGYAGAMVAAVAAGMVLPEIAKAVTQGGWRVRGRGGELVFLVGLFACNGLLVDAFYRSQAWLLGDDAGLRTVLLKMLVDMLGFTPFVALPLIMLAFAWRRHGYRVSGVAGEIRSAGVGRWYVRRVVPLLLPGWTFWTPMVLLIYSLPGGLQFALWAAALAAWSLVMVFIGDDRAEPADVDPSGVGALGSAT